MEAGLISDQMGEFTLGNGSTIKCTALADLSDLMAESTKETITMTKKKDRELLFGQMERCIQEVGLMVNNMALDGLLLMMNLPDEESGSKEKGSDGSIIKTANYLNIIKIN